MNLNFAAIAVATLLQFAVGAVWYMFIFNKLWGKMHNFDRYSPEEQKKMAAKMGPYYVLQLFLTLVTTTILAMFDAALPAEWHAFGVAGFLWLGFVAPAQISAVVFGGTEPKWMLKKILVSIGGSLAGLLVAAAILGNM